MSANKRRPFIGGNWKSNGTKKSVQDLISALNKVDIPSSTDVVIAPVFIHIPMVQQHLSNHSIKVGAQNCSPFKQGAHTGEVAPDQLKDLSIDWVILGHSERRQEFKEDDETVAKKTKLALDNGLSVIWCCGETLEQREAHKEQEVVTNQLQALRSAVDDWTRIVIAYEPVWAIGTGKNASAQQAQDMHSVIRSWLKKKISDKVAVETRILYGGSVKGSTAGELNGQPDIDGFLVGGASLKADEFGTIIASTGGSRSKL